MKHWQHANTNYDLTTATVQQLTALQPHLVFWPSTRPCQHFSKLHEVTISLLLPSLCNCFKQHKTSIIETKTSKASRSNHQSLMARKNSETFFQKPSLRKHMILHFWILTKCTPCLWCPLISVFFIYCPYYMVAIFFLASCIFYNRFKFLLYNKNIFQFISNLINETIVSAVQKQTETCPLVTRSKDSTKILSFASQFTFHLRWGIGGHDYGCQVSIQKAFALYFAEREVYSNDK